MKTLIFLATLFPVLAFAQAQVFPTRLTLTEEAPSSYLNLKNATTSTQKYRIEFAQYQMKSDGTVVKSDTQNNQLTDVLKFSPKTVELAPNEKQVVRVMATSFDGMQDGDYHIYLHFIPDGTAAPTENANKSKFTLQARIAVAVPVVVRHGTAKIDGKLSNFKAVSAKDGGLDLSLKLANSTKYFLTGDMDFVAVTAKGETPIAKTAGITSYIPERAVTSSISAKDLAEKLNGEAIKKIKVKFASNENSGATFELSGETEVGAAIAEKKNKKTNKRQ